LLARRNVIYWPIILSFLWPLAFIAILSGPFGLVVIGIWPVVLLWGLSAALALVFLIDFTTKRDWLRASAMLPLPLTDSCARNRHCVFQHQLGHLHYQSGT
jgi:hypothetical protein